MTTLIITLILFNFFNFLFLPEEIELFLYKNESEKIIYFDSKLLFIWKQNILILQNCPAFFAQIFIPGVQGGSWGPPPKICTRASKNLATPLLFGIDLVNKLVSFISNISNSWLGLQQNCPKLLYRYLYLFLFKNFINKWPLHSKKNGDTLLIGNNKTNAL